MVCRKTFAIACVLAVALFVVACGSDDDKSSGGGGAGGASTQATAATKGIKKAPTLAASQNAKGSVTYCLGKDTAGNNTAAVKDFNAKYGGQGLTAKLL